MNHVEIKWPAGASDGLPILIAHDLEMLRLLNIPSATTSATTTTTTTTPTSASHLPK
jgi:hypothetical protein